MDTETTSALNRSIRKVGSFLNRAGLAADDFDGFALYVPSLDGKPAIHESNGTLLRRSMRELRRSLNDLELSINAEYGPPRHSDEGK